MRKERELLWSVLSLFLSLTRSPTTLDRTIQPIALHNHLTNEHSSPIPSTTQPHHPPYSPPAQPNHTHRTQCRPSTSSPSASSPVSCPSSPSSRVSSSSRPGATTSLPSALLPRSWPLNHPPALPNMRNLLRRRQHPNITHRILSHGDEIRIIPFLQLSAQRSQRAKGLRSGGCGGFYGLEGGEAGFDLFRCKVVS
jgi:hypothetical protein